MNKKAVFFLVIAVILIGGIIFFIQIFLNKHEQSSSVPQTASIEAESETVPADARTQQEVFTDQKQEYDPVSTQGPLLQ